MSSLATSFLPTSSSLSREPTIGFSASNVLKNNPEWILSSYDIFANWVELLSKTCIINSVLFHVING